MMVSIEKGQGRDADHDQVKMGCRDDAVYTEKRWRWLRSALLMVVKPMVMPVTELRREEEKLVMMKIATCWDRDRGEARKENEPISR